MEWWMQRKQLVSQPYFKPDILPTSQILKKLKQPYTITMLSVGLCIPQSNSERLNISL
jgi:hypothetical protein